MKICIYFFKRMYLCNERQKINISLFIIHYLYITNKMLKYFLTTLFTGIVAFFCQSLLFHKPNPINIEDRKYRAMVVCAHPEAAKVGQKILSKGGNALDAAVAVQYALAVVFPVAGNLGGGGFMVMRRKDGNVLSLDYREKAPAAATKDMYLDKNKNVIPDLSLYGHLAAGVPGSVAGIFESHAKLGKLPMKTLIQPAIDLAEKGFPLTQKDAEMLNNIRERFKKYNTVGNAFLADTFIAGKLFKQPDLARTLRLIRDKGKAGFYEGETADKIVAEMRRGEGIMTYQDLKNYEAKWREPIQNSYKGYEITSMAPPSSGGVALVQLLKMIEPYPIAKNGQHSPEVTHLMVEAEKRAYADRAKHLGDKDFYPVPVQGLLKNDYLTSRMKDYNPAKATPSTAIEAGIPIAREHEETTHLSVVDMEGNAVSVTTTLNNSFGSAVVVGGAGFILNDEMDDFSSKPGVPNFYGLIGSEANAIQPEKRMLSSMTPTIVSKDGKLFMVVGTPGGSTIITSVFQTIINVIEHGMTMQEAVASPRFHHQWLPDKIMYEKGTFTAAQIQTLQTMGHTLEQRPGPSGRVDAILVKKDGTLQGGADPRGDDTWLGVE